jgi:hypothetical protein
MVRKPKPAKKVKVEKSKVAKGGRPVKQFVIDALWERDASNALLNDKRYSQRYDTQKDVLDAAKALALQYQAVLRIELKAFCQGDTVLATVTPEKGEQGIWEFTVAFRS